MLYTAAADVWDGTIVSYASEIKKYEGINRLTSSTSLETVNFLFRSEFFLARIFHTSYYKFDRILLGIAMVMICRVIWEIVHIRLREDRYVSSLALCLFLTFPIWHILTSTTQTFYIVFTALGLTGLLFLYREKRYVQLFGVLLLIASFEMNSFLMVAPVLSVVFEITESRLKSFSRRIKLPAFVMILVAVYWIISRRLSSPSGLYSNYNKLINPFTEDGWKIIKSGFTDFSTFFIFPLLSASLLSVLYLFTLSSGSEKVLRHQRPRAILLIPLSVVSIAPYVLVEKSARVDDFDWSGRHAILLSVPFSIAVALFGKSFLSMNVKGKLKSHGIRALVLLLLLTPQGSILLTGLKGKFHRQIIDSELSNALEGTKIPSGVVEIVGLPAQIPDHRVYESNYIMWRTFHESVWWTRIGPSVDPNFSIPPWLSDPAYQEMYISSPVGSPCHSTVTVNLRESEDRLRPIKLLLHARIRMKIEVVSVESSCR